MLTDEGNYKLDKGDCLEVMKDIPDKSINLVLIDPPYNIGKDKWDKWDTAEDYVEFMGKVFLEIQRVLKDNGSFYFFHNDFPQMSKLQNWIEDNSNFIFRQMIVWNKRFEGASNKGFLDGYVIEGGRRNYQKMCEYCLYYTFQQEDSDNFQTRKLKQYFFNAKKESGLTTSKINKLLGHRNAEHTFYTKKQWQFPKRKTYEELQTILNLPIDYDDLIFTFNNQKIHHSVMNYEIPKKQGHITPKPIDMLEYLIKTSSNEEDIILDCFMGSGSTGVAALNCSRRFIGIELDEKYFNIAIKRLEDIGKVI